MSLLDDSLTVLVFNDTFLTSGALRTFFALIDFFFSFGVVDFSTIFFGFDSKIILDIYFINRSIEDISSSFAGII